MSLASGVHLGPYEILAPLGAGGMGEVYRARDTRLGREVAVKVVRAGFTADAERLQRFEQEARAAAALNHPNILGVHDIGQHDGAPYLVTELLDGETLRERLTGGPLPVRKAVEYAIQLAHGLAAAHEKGIVHRDLKPENIFLTADGRVKILDFGLAKLVQTDTAMAGLTDLPTAPPQTDPGLVLGTMGYMAPEQVRGLAVDHHADIFAFGVVFYEMLSGRRAFQGQTAIDTMTAILKEDPPDLPLAERHIPPALAKIVDRCLEKSPAARFQTASDLGFALDALSTQSGHTEIGAAIPLASKHRFPDRLAWAAAGALVAAAVTASSLIYLRSAPSAAVPIRFSVAAAPKSTLAVGNSAAITPVVSPDGRRMVFAASTSSNNQLVLWIRSLDTLDAQPLAGTDLPTVPFWSPDSRTVAFLQAGKLKTIDASGGPVQTVCDGPVGRGTWNRDGTIVFGAGAANTGLFKVPAAGGQATPLTKLDASRREAAHRGPSFLPDGRHFVFMAPPTSTIWIGSLDTTETTKLLTADSQAQYANGHLLFVRQGTLMAQAFDERRLTLTGDAVPIAEQVQPDGTTGYSAFSVSENGVLTYRTGSAIATTQLTWMDRGGKPLDAIGPSGRYRNPALSPDGTRLAVEVIDQTGHSEDVWLVELARGVMSRFTFDPANDVYPVWSPDGTRIMFASDRAGGVFNMYQKQSNGAGDDELVFKSSDGDKKPYSWSPDGRYLVYIAYPHGAANYLGVLPLFGDRKPLPFPTGSFSTSFGQVSPDGRWVAYGSSESGRYEVYVRSFPTPGGKWQISKDGAASPRWRGDGKELFYYAADGQLMAVPIKAGETALEVGTPTRLFAPRVLNGPVAAVGFRAQYDVTRDGQRFLLNVPAEDAAPPSITVVVNWPAGLKK
jgi:serine/threonine protein kinase/Tol biopolymer transport system component